METPPPAVEPTAEEMRYRRLDSISRALSALFPPPPAPPPPDPWTAYRRAAREWHRELESETWALQMREGLARAAALRLAYRHLGPPPEPPETTEED